jgi:hypothetical protein
VVTGFGLTPATPAVPDICAWADCAAEIATATNINVAVSVDLMRSLGVIVVPGIKHIWLVGNRDAMVHEARLGL